MNSKRISDVIAISLLFIFVMGMFVYSHEIVHVDIADRHGCTGEIDPIPSWEDGYVMATEIQCPVDQMTEEEQLAHRVSQDTVDTAGYQIMWILILLLAMYFGFDRRLRKIERQLSQQGGVDE